MQLDSVDSVALDTEPLQGHDIDKETALTFGEFIYSVGYVITTLKNYWVAFGSCSNEWLEHTGDTDIYKGGYTTVRDCLEKNDMQPIYGSNLGS